jgi:steroid 5-alpha reductase family enzyme
MDRTRHTRARCTAKEIGGRRVLPLRAEPAAVGFAARWIGLWVVFGHANPITIATVVTVAVGVHLFVVFYEEPVLREKFCADYDEYYRNVSRWWPRLRGWDKPQ